MTYLILNIVFVIAIVVILRMRIHRPSKAWWITFCVLILLTLIFDNVIVGLDIVAYNSSQILGVFAGFAPIEDFFYAILACIIVPFLWNNLSLKKELRHDR